MAFKYPSSYKMTTGAALTLRAVLLSALVLCTAELLLHTRHYFTASTLLIAAILVVRNIFAVSSSAERTFAQAVDGMLEGTQGRPISPLHPELSRAVEKAFNQLATDRMAMQRKSEYLRALCDNIPVALFTRDANQEWNVVNRAAWKMVGAQGTRRLQDILGREGMTELQNLDPGRQSILHVLPGGSRLLASCGSWIAGDESKTLVALVPVDQMLDRVETQAWQDLVRVLSHEMMNSLTPITSLTASLPSVVYEIASPNRTQLVSDVITALNTIHERSNGLVSFLSKYRAISEAPTIAAQPVEVNELIRRTLELMGYLGPGLITHHMDTGELTISADPHLLEQALINVLRNALDAVASAERPEIEIRSLLRDQYVAICISDNGVGIDPQTANRVFVPFFSTKAGGFGVGLTLVRQIVLAHGGRIEIAPAQPHGTIVTLLFPT